MKNIWKLNWKMPIFIISAAMSIILIISFYLYGSFYTTYGTDFIAYWSTGKVAAQSGYASIYNLENLRYVLTPELQSLNLVFNSNSASIRIIPAAYFSFFIVPFQFLSSISLLKGYWLWTIVNLAVQVGYLLFFLRAFEGGAKENGLKLLVLILISYTELSNFFNGQINVLLLICTGEFIRNAVNQKPVLSGLWLGGLLIKPPALVLIVPVILILRNWKTLIGFAATSIAVILLSFLLSGAAGMKAMIDLWVGNSACISTSNAEAMINWRMAGLNLNHLFGASFGWVITGLGMSLTIGMLTFLIRKTPPLGNSGWVLTMLGVFSATLAFTWHAHQHMAMVLIPFLLFASIYKLLPENILFLWATVPQVVWFGTVILGASNNHTLMAVAFSGLLMNLVILFSTIRFVNQKIQ